MMLWMLMMGGGWLGGMLLARSQNHRDKLRRVEDDISSLGLANNHLRLEVQQLRRQLELALPPPPPGDGPYREAPEPTAVPGAGVPRSR